MSDKTCEDCWYCEYIHDGIIYDENIRNCSVGKTGSGVKFYDKACDKFLSTEDGLKLFVDGYRSAHKSNNN